ncbi:SH3 domain-containing protein [Xanthobacteraceae bacterium A53D]
MLVLLLALAAVPAQAAGPQALPYFAALKREVTNVRAGPGTDYPVLWVYRRAGWPVEVLNRFENWRRIRDHAGDVGWVHSAMLARRHTAAVEAPPDGHVALTRRPDASAPTKALLAQDVLVELETCRADWCRISVAGRTGYVPQDRLWGIYPGDPYPPAPPAGG